MRSLPIALTIAGSDSGGGAGIQADLKTFAAVGVHGTSAITCLTAQNPKTVLRAQPVEIKFIELQLEALFNELPPRAIKTGMLYSAEIISAVKKFLARKKTPLVVDPVMIATSGAMLLENSAVVAMKDLFSIADLITPNLDEAEALLGTELNSVEDLRLAAKEIHKRFGCAALVKGGHLQGMKEAIDIYYDGREERLLTAPMIRGVKTHGTGCTYSAAITAHLAHGLPLLNAVSKAKEFVTSSIAHSVRIGRHQALGWSSHS